MDRLNEIQVLLGEIRAKHNIAASFRVNNFGGLKDPKFNTYIASDIGICHRDHHSFEDAVQRFKEFISIDDLSAYNKELAEGRYKELCSEQEDISLEIDRIKRILGGA